MESLGQMKWYFLISRKQTSLLLSMPEYRNCGRYSLVDRVLSHGGMSQGKAATPSPHYDHQTLIFPSSLPRGLALLMEILHFLEENGLSNTIVLVGINSDAADRQQKCRGQDQRLFLFISWQV